MKTFDANIILAKNELYSKQPWIVLFDLEVDSDTTEYLAAYPEDVTWNGNTYTACPAAIEAITETDSGRLDGLNIHIANVDRLISGYVENNTVGMQLHIPGHVHRRVYVPGPPPKHQPVAGQSQ